MPVNHSSSLDKLLDYMPDLIEKTNNMMNRCIQNKKEETQKILKTMQENKKKTKEKDQESKKEVERKIEKEIKKTVTPEETTYEFEYDETMEDE